jgi:aminoglycoside phosphotransferase (APT) family kinase protein
LVHNDYKFDNVMLDPDDPTRIVAVLDWEMCTVGDPLLDLGTTLGYWTEPNDDPAWRAMGLTPTAAAGGLTRAEVAQRYADRSGHSVDHVLFAYVFGLLKIGGIVQQIFFRYAQGHTKDPRFAKLDRVVAALGRMAAAAIERGTL